jgi:tetratricopeptide (TPR) repeat protein
MSSQRNDVEFWDDLASIVDGDQNAVAKHADLLADSDEHRDARYEAQGAANLVGDAGLDYYHPGDFEAKVLAAVDSRPKQVAPAEAPKSTLPYGAPDPSLAMQGYTPPQAYTPPPGYAPPTTPGFSHHTSAPVPKAAAMPRTMAHTPPTHVSGIVNAQPKKKSNTGKVVVLFGGLAAAAVVLLAVGGVGVYFLTKDGGLDGGTASAEIGALGGTLSQIRRAADDNVTGVEIRSAGATDFAPLPLGAIIPAGSIIRTDARTRAEVQLTDGSTIVLNHSSEVAFNEETPRMLELKQGQLVADVAHIENAPQAIYATSTGRIVVLGTKFVLSSTADSSNVQVTRGRVRMEGMAGSNSEVKAGQEGVMPQAGAVSVSPAINMSEGIEWSELGAAEEGTEQAVRGLGELRARRPGEREDTERPLTLAHHRATVRIVGNVARTEIEETFRNDSDQTLEGIYRFPMPPDARIASLQLLVEDTWEEGAIVERNRAQKIWRGVIRNATPQARRQQQEEFVWVPGPWRDPALLEWQRGGRFELRIFPIPANGARSVRIAYTQQIAPHGRSGRRFVMPLAHSSDASTRVGRFETDIRVAGNEGDVTAHGYEMARVPDDGATHMTYAADNFQPAGDLLVDYQLPNPDAEVRWWTFNGDATVAPPENTRERNEEVDRLQREIDADTRPYVVFAVRPDLPAWTEGESRDYVFVVDSSQSMVGERFDRAKELVSTLIREMDRRDRFAVLACDIECRAMNEQLQSPSRQLADQTAAWLGQIEPAGATDLTTALSRATALGQSGDHMRRVIYLGDGIASTGHRRASSLAAEVRDIVGPTLSVSTVGIGGDADTQSLAAIARAGNGHYVPYVPGQRLTGAAMAVLESTYGTSLTNARIEVPEGVVDVSPRELPTVRAGEEVIVVGRLARPDVTGNVSLSGKVGGRDYSQRFPVTLEVSDSAGNAFVPRQWASATIEQLELEGRGENEAKIVALSKAYGVMSRLTSLLVLESEAMFQAFGIDRGQPTLQWTGDEEMVMGESQGLETFSDGVVANAGSIGHAGGRSARARSGAGAGLRGDDSGGAMPAAEASADEESAREAPMAPPMQAQTAATPVARRPMGPGTWMRRVWFRTGSVSTDSGVSSRDATRVAEAESALRLNPDSRDRHRELYRALSRSGDVERALEIANAWIERDRMDPDALTARADALARLGDRDEAVRVLSGIVDLRPDDRALQARLADAYDRAGLMERGCSHRVAISELDASSLSNGGDVRARNRRTDNRVFDSVGAALRCERMLGRNDAVTRLLGALPSDEARTQAEAAAAELAAPRTLRADVMVDATWSGGADLDVSIIQANGTRVSWMGGHNNVVGENASRVGEERLGVRGLGAGSYLIEVSRAGDDTTPISGSLRVRAIDGNRTIPFTLTGSRLVLGRIDIRRESRMEQVSGPAW